MCHVKATLSRSSHDFAGLKGRERTGVPDVVSLSGTDGLAAWDVTRGDAMVSIVLRGAPLGVIAVPYIWNYRRQLAGPKPTLLEYFSLEFAVGVHRDTPTRNYEEF